MDTVEKSSFLEELAITRGVPPALLYPLWKMRHFHIQHRCLQSIQTEIATYNAVMIFGLTAMDT